MKRTYLPLTALIAGFGLAFLAAGVHSLFFALLPLTAIAFGYYSSWRGGLFFGLLLFIGYTFAISLIWWGLPNPNLIYPMPYIAAFVGGGFFLLLIGVTAPQLRKGLKRVGSIAVVLLLVVLTGWCGYTAVPHCSYYYQVAIIASENIKNFELYVPVGTVLGEPYDDLYDSEYKVPGILTANFTREIVDTEYGKMFKTTIPELKEEDVPVPRYTANIIFWYSRDFWQKIAPNELIQLMPKSDVTPVDTIISQRFTGPVKSREHKIIERFNVPLKISADSQAQIRLTVWNRTDRAGAIHFTSTYTKTYPYTERLDYDVQTDGDWILVPVEASTIFEIRGISD